MSNARLGSQAIVNNGTYTAAAGSSRRLVVLGHASKDTGTPTWAATFGGVAMTLDAQSAYVGDDKLLVFSLLEALIPSGSQTLVVTPSGGAALTNFHGAIYTLGGQDQSALDTGFSSSGTGAATTLTTGSLTNVTGSILLAVLRQSTGDAVDTRPSGWTQRHVDAVSQTTSIEEKDDAAAATATYSWTSGGSAWIYQTVAYKAAATSATLTPAPAVVTLNGHAPTTSAFLNVRIREVLVNESGQVVGGAANIHLAVWYGGILLGAPDLSINGLTTDAAGTTSWSIATGTLAYNQPIFYVAQDSLSYSNYTCARMIPSYE